MLDCFVNALEQGIKAREINLICVGLHDRFCERLFAQILCRIDFAGGIQLFAIDRVIAPFPREQVLDARIF